MDGKLTLAGDFSTLINQICLHTAKTDCCEHLSLVDTNISENAGIFLDTFLYEAAESEGFFFFFKLSLGFLSLVVFYVLC